MAKKYHKKGFHFTVPQLLLCILGLALLIYFGATFPKSIVAYAPDDILSYSLKYVPDISTGEQAGYLTGTYDAKDPNAVAISQALGRQYYRRQVFGSDLNVLDAEGMVEVNLVSSSGDWFVLRSYSDGSVLITSPKTHDKPVAVRHGWGFSRNNHELFRNLAEIAVPQA